MNYVAPTKNHFTGAIGRYLKTPKGILLVVLAALATAASLSVEFSRTIPLIAAAVIAAVATEQILMALVRKERSFPSGAILTGLIVAVVLSPATSPFVAAAVSAIAIASKYVFRTRWSNVFNPAALALVIAYFIFGTGQSWWGGLPDLPVFAIVLLIASGAFMADRVNKIPMALVYLGTFFGLATVTVLAANPAVAQELFRVPDVNAALFFALFMLDDPPTSPTKYGDQIMFALIAAVVSYAVFTLIGGVYYLPAGVLVANVWETLRRHEERSNSKAAVARKTGVPSQGSSRSDRFVNVA